MYKKITFGFTIQSYNDKGKCVSQEFVAGDQVDYEDMNGEPIQPPENEVYQPYDMVQPNQVMFTSCYDDDSVIVTPALYNEETGEVEILVTVDILLDAPNREYITLPDGDEIEMCPICHSHVMKTVMVDGLGKTVNEAQVCSGGCEQEEE